MAIPPNPIGSLVHQPQVIGYFGPNGGGRIVMPPVPTDVAIGFKNSGPPVPVDVSHGFKNPNPVPISPAPVAPVLPPAAPQPIAPQPTVPFDAGRVAELLLGGAPHGNFLEPIHPHLQHVHAILHAHGNAIQSLINAIHGLGGHQTQPGRHSESTHEAVVAKRAMRNNAHGRSVL